MKKELVSANDWIFCEPPPDNKAALVKDRGQGFKGTIQRTELIQLKVISIALDNQFEQTLSPGQIVLLPADKANFPWFRTVHSYEGVQFISVPAADIVGIVVEPDDDGETVWPKASKETQPA